jgi:hypothetical protein
MSMTKDGFLETLIAQYKDEIEEALDESEHIYRLTIDYEILDQKVLQLIQSAKIDGLDEKILWDLLQARIPSYVNYINFKVSGKKTA